MRTTLIWLRKNTLPAISVSLLTGILYFLWQIYGVFNTIPEKFQANQNEHARIEAELKERIDKLEKDLNDEIAGKQRQISELRGWVFEMKFQK